MHAISAGLCEQVRGVYTGDDLVCVCVCPLCVLTSGLLQPDGQSYAARLESYTFCGVIHRGACNADAEKTLDK